MHIIDGNSGVHEINDSAFIKSFIKMKPGGEPLVINGFEKGICLDDIVELCIYDGDLKISQSEDNLSDLVIAIRRKLGDIDYTISIKYRIEQLSIYLGWKEIVMLPGCIMHMKNLKTLRLLNAEIISLPESIGKLTSLSSLVLSGTGLTTLPESIGKLTSLSSLDLSWTKITTLPESIGKLTSLSSLDLRGTKITTLSENIGKLTSLSSLDLRGTKITTLPESIGKLTSLSSLDLRGTKITTPPESIGNLPSLSSLVLRNTGLTTLPESIGNLTSLSSLVLRDTGLTTLPESIGNLTSLSGLDLGNTKLTALPKSIGNLKSLQRLDLRGLSLSSIDKPIVDLNLEFYESEYYSDKGINILGLSLETQPVSLFLQPRPLIEEYYASEMVPVNTTKCIVLGYGNAGKTYTLSRLLNGGAKGDYDTKETPGVEIRSYETKRKSGAFTINFWDFGGQEIMYSMHRCFLTERSCYMIVLDNRRADMDMMAQARFWLKNIAAFSHGAPVIIMANMWEKDQYRDDIEIKRLREEFGESVDLRCVIPISAKTSSKKQFKTELIDKIEELAESMVSHNMEFPVKWSRIRSELHEMGQGHSNYYISQEDYYSICQKHGVENRDIQDWLLDWFNDLGDCFSYYKSNTGLPSDLIGEYKVLDPRWITNAIYILITRGYGFIDHQRSPGILTKTAIEKILENAEGGVITYIKKYKDFECSYIMRVMEKFELAYDVTRDGKKYFIPALLTKKEPDNKRPEQYRQLVKYILEYDFLPSNILHKLMVRFYNELELNRCWNKGMVLRNAAIDQWVLLDMGGGDDKLHIEVFACGEDPACKMLNLTLNRLQIVNESLSLKPVHYIITSDEYEQEIEVEDLLELKNGPRKRDFYQGKKIDYPIDELLGNTFGPVARSVNKTAEKKVGGEAEIGAYTPILLNAIRKFEESIRSEMRSKNPISIPITDAIEKRFRKQFDTPPSDEKEVQVQLRKFLDANGYQQGRDYERESGKFQFAGREYIPDFVLKESKTALEVKFLKDRAKKSKIIEEMNADCSAYTKEYDSLIFLVYDIGCISDTEQFKRDFEGKGNVRVLVVKH